MPRLASCSWVAESYDLFRASTGLLPDVLAGQMDAAKILRLASAAKTFHLCPWTTVEMSIHYRCQSEISMPLQARKHNLSGLPDAEQATAAWSG